MRFVLCSLVSLLLACEGETVIEKMDNSAPTALIVSHSDGVSLEEGYVVNFRATVSDQNDAVDTLSMAWYVGQEVVCDWSSVSIGGDQSCSIEIVEGMTSIIAEVRDPEGAGGRSEISIVVLPTEAPTVSIEMPLQGSRHYADELIELSGIVGDAEDDVADLLIEWTSNVDGILASPQPDSDGAISDYVLLSEGQHALELSVEDTSGKRSSSSVVVTVGAANTLPSCELTEPSDGAAAVVGAAVRFRGVADDPDIPNDQMLVSWSSDKDGAFGTGTPSSDGSITYSFDGLSTNEHVITMQVQDEVGATCTDQIVFTVGNPPTTLIDNPLNGTVVTLGDPVTLQGTVADTEDASSQLSVEWVSSQDGVLYSGTASSQGNTQTTVNTLSAGAHLLTLTATDSSGLWTDTSVDITVNTPPPVPNVAFASNVVYGSDTLTVIASPSVDADGDVVSLQYEWFENGQATSFTSTSISSSELSAGEVWTVRVTPNDGYVDGIAAELSVTIQNSTPVISNVSVSPATVFTGNTLTCTATAVDPDDGTLVPLFDWSVNGVPSGTGTTFTVTDANTNVGDTVMCTATAQDSSMLSVSDTASVVVQNAGPTISNIIISSTAGYYNDQQVECSATVTDPDEVVLPDFEWFGASGYLGSGSLLDLSTTSAMPGDALNCTVSASDSNGTTAQSSAQVSIANRAPYAPQVSVSPTMPVVGVDDLTCFGVETGDPDGQSVMISGYAWTSDFGNTATGPVLPTSSISDSETWTCTVTVSDGMLIEVGSDSVQAIAGGMDPLTFTTCGQTGRYGPSQSQCDIEYAGTDLDGMLSFVDGVQVWTVPSTGTYTIEAYGAQGGAKGSSLGGSGAYVSGEFQLNSGEELYIVVGQRGIDISSTYSVNYNTEGGGGGGGSFVFDSSNSPFLVAGGGGGASYQGAVGYGGSSTNSSVGSGYGQSSGGGGGQTDNSGGGGTGAGGGGFYANGQSNNWCNGGAANGRTGGASNYSGLGGFGGGGGSYHGGGGGGGFTGGGGGTYTIGGGGAGSYNIGSNPIAYPNYNATHGMVVISQ